MKYISNFLSLFICLIKLIVLLESILSSYGVIHDEAQSIDELNQVLQSGQKSITNIADGSEQITEKT